MEDGSLLLGPILVTGAPGVDVPGASQVVIGPQDIERLAPRDLADLFRITPSVSVGSSIPMSQKLYVNGVEETNLAVSIDGARQNNRIFHHNATNVIDPALLAQARVEAGVAPADAGPGALGGAVTFETIDARDLLGFEDGAGARSSNSFDFNGDVATSAFTVYGMRDGFEGLASVNVGKGGDFEDGDGNTVDGSETDFVSSLVKGAWESEAGHRFELGYERVADDADRPFRANIGSVGDDAGLRNYDIVRQNTVFTYTDESPEGWLDPRVVIGYAQDRAQRPRVDHLGSVEQRRHRQPVGADREQLRLRPRERWSPASTPIRTRRHYSDPDYSATEKARNVGLYAQARLEPFERARHRLRRALRLPRSSRGSTADLGQFGLRGNIGGEYDVTDGLTVRAAYSHVWAGPALAENFIMNPDWDYAGGLKPMTANNVTAGLRLHAATRSCSRRTGSAPSSTTCAPRPGRTARRPAT